MIAANAAAAAAVDAAESICQQTAHATLTYLAAIASASFTTYTSMLKLNS